MFVTISYIAVRTKCENACKELTMMLADVKNFVNYRYYPFLL